MSDFSEKLLRLKQALQMAEDQQIAAALGLSKAAFSDRKRREAFPDDLVIVLASKRPDLKIDAEYVLSGERVAAEAEQVIAKRGKFAPPVDSKVLAACIQLVTDGAKGRGLDLDWAAIGVVAGGLYDMSSATRAPNPKLVDALLNAYLAGQGRQP